jgi:hypothetical protein
MIGHDRVTWFVSSRVELYDHSFERADRAGASSLLLLIIVTHKLAESVRMIG